MTSGATQLHLKNFILLLPWCLVFPSENTDDGTYFPDSQCGNFQVSGWM